ncbi:MAG TPA: hypothetical protein VER12_19245 [Polyangiaceae bacterium]|nr:hypothetical protein [Polyangiaceae bacterium]
MPDSADNGRPSSAPLSAEDADRLADSFTAFWEDTPAPADSAAAAPAVVTAPEPAALAAPSPATVTAPMPTVTAPGPAMVTAPSPATVTAPSPGTVTAPMPATPASPVPATVTAPMPAIEPAPKPKPIGKQTLIGIAPITIEKASQRPPEPAHERPAPPEPIQSSPEVPGYAIAYTPKDSPSTPAVVIAPEAQSSPEHAAPENRRAFSQTIPSRVRSAPNAALAPATPPAPPTRAVPSPEALDDFNPYAPKGGKGKVIGMVLGGALLLLISVVGVRTLGGGLHQSAEPSSATDVVRAATVGATTPTSEPVEPAAAAPIPAPAQSAVREPVSTRTAQPPASERTTPTKAKAKAKAVFAPTAGRPATRAPTPEPSPAPAKPASKGVIVRDAPF